MVNLGPLTAEICWRVWGTPANFIGFRVLAALLHGTLVVGVVTGQLADAIGEFACLVFRFGGICETASCPVRDLSCPRVGNPRVGVSASCPVTVGVSETLRR